MQELEKEFNFNMKKEKKEYRSELIKAMTFLGKKRKTIFIGQAVSYPGTAMTGTLDQVSIKKKIELPVAEEMQLGISLGLSFQGYTPISIFPRWNFLLLAANQLVNHIDKINEMGSKKFRNKIIIRTSVGSERPLHPQSQHVGNFTNAFKSICQDIDFIVLNEPHDIFNAYKKAYERKDNKSTVLVEYGDYYAEK
jgi:pyruvate/2-oxoglutarate/acetoin dehydrogenase E1 component